MESVSILVLVEATVFRFENDAKEFMNESFNPCFSGSYRFSRKENMEQEPRVLFQSLF